MVFEENQHGIVLRVRLAPNSSCCKIKGVFVDADGAEWLKISVVSVPEKGKANQELIKFLATELKAAKTDIEIISGELDRYKKLLLRAEKGKLKTRLEEILNDCTDY